MTRLSINAPTELRCNRLRAAMRCEIMFVNKCDGAIDV